MIQKKKNILLVIQQIRWSWVRRNQTKTPNMERMKISKMIIMIKKKKKFLNRQKRKLVDLSLESKNLNKIILTMIKHFLITNNIIQVNPIVIRMKLIKNKLLFHQISSKICLKLIKMTNKHQIYSLNTTLRWNFSQKTIKIPKKKA